MNSPVTTSRRSSPASSLGSIQGLPLELVREIFLFATMLKFERLTDESPAPPRFSTTALVLSHVNSYWRSITLSFPELWASIAVCCPTDGLVELAKLYLERSGETTLLDLSLVDVHNSVPCDNYMAARRRWEDYSYTILMLWISQAQRWRGLNLTIRMPGPIKEFLHIPAHYLCNLENASLDFINWESEDIQCIWDAVHTSPNLREIHWNSPSVEHPPLAMFHHITSLSVWCLSLEELATLSSLAQLVNLAVTSFQESPKGRMIELPVLESLSVGYVQKDSSWLLGQIATPNLRYLHLEQCVELVDVAALHLFLLRNKCSLRQLRLGMYKSSEVSVLKYVQKAAPLLLKLKSFTFQFPGITEMTVKELVPRTDDGQPFLPDLEELSLLGCRLEDGLIGRMVAGRCNAGKPLGAFKVWFSAKEGQHSLDGAILNRLKETGVLTKLKCSYSI